MESLPERRPIIRGDRVFLRAPERSDVPDFVRWFNDAEVLHHLAMRGPMSEAAEERWFDAMLERQSRTDHHFVICLLDGGRAIGTVGLHAIDMVEGTASFGIAIGEAEYWNRGLGTDATRAICDFGFGELRLDRIELQVYAGNDRGRRVYEKAGFVLEGTLRSAHYHHGARVDVHVMGLLREEWAASSHRRSWEAG